MDHVSKKNLGRKKLDFIGYEKKKKRTHSQMGRKRRSGSVNSWGKQTIYENLKEIRKTQTFLK